MMRTRLPAGQRAIVRAAIDAGMAAVVVDVAAGRVPESLPAVGVSSRGHRCWLSAQHCARTAPHQAATVWALLRAGLDADEHHDVLEVDVVGGDIVVALDVHQGGAVVADEAMRAKRGRWVRCPRQAAPLDGRAPPVGAVTSNPPP